MIQKNILRRAFAVALSILMFVTCTCIPVTAVTENSWTLSESTEIFWVKTTDSEADYLSLAPQIRRFSADLAGKVTSTARPVSYGERSKAASGDIILVLDGTSGIPAQGYSIVATNENVTVTASDAAGLMYGCNNLIQQLITVGSVTTDSSSPDVAERALFLDIGRKYYSVDWIKGMIRELAWSNMNTLVVHFSEEMGLGLESKTYPWLNGRDGTLCTQEEVATDNRYITQAEMAEIIAYAKQYHVEIVPSFDSPGHMNYIVKKFNEQCASKDFSFTYDGKTYTASSGSEIGNYYHYNGKTSIVKGSRNTNYSRGIDISNEVAVAFTRSLVTEYARFFRNYGCTKFDIGGDELLGWGSAIVSGVNKWEQLDHWKEYAQTRAKEEGLENHSAAVAYDGFMYYMNDMYDLVTNLGYTSVRMWNDDAYRTSDTGWTNVVNLDPGMEILFWSASTNEKIEKYNQHGLYNYLSDYNYLALTEDWYSDDRGSFKNAYPDLIYNDWNPYNFGDSGSKQIGNDTVKGSAVCIWSDNPALKTETEVRESILPLLRANGAKAWDSEANSSVTYNTFAARQQALGNAPAVATGSEIYAVADITALAEAVNAFSAVDSALYTEESYAAYQAAVEDGEALLKSSKPSQEAVNAALQAINNAYGGLCEVGQSGEIGNANCFISGAFKTSKVNVGKYATIGISAIKGSDIKDFVITNKNGSAKTILKMSRSTQKSDRDNWTVVFKPVLSEVGGQTYIVHAVLSDGKWSADCLELNIQVVSTN